MKHLLRNFIISGIYNLQVTFGVQPKGIYLLSGCPRSGTSAMRNWLQQQKQVASLFEPRILIGAHRFFEVVERFDTLHTNRQMLIAMIRQLVFKYCAKTKYIWNKQLVLKEPLEPMAFPDERYREFVQNSQIIFPEIKLFFMIRDPVATIWSMTQRQWGYSQTNQVLRNYSIEECIKIWRACIELIQEYASDHDVYICQFERLINDPEDESHRIFDFLSIRGNQIFQPKQTKVPGFSDSDRKLIERETRSLWEQVSAIGK